MNAAPVHLPKEASLLSDVARQTYPFTLPDLPYAYDALEPHIDGKTLQLHHREHHATYVKKLNEAVSKAPELQRVTLLDLLRDVAKLPETVRSAIVDNGGGHLNHDFFWNAMSPPGAGAAPNNDDPNNLGRAPRGRLAEALAQQFGSFEEFRTKFSDAAAKHFASGWIALAFDHASRQLQVLNLKDHTVLKPGEKTGLLILDVWEHAYYVKYQNRRPEFIAAFWNVVNWAYAEEKFARALASS
jgi:superoxide dismutase, Fe-Mn family